MMVTLVFEGSHFRNTFILLHYIYKGVTPALAELL